MAMCGSEGLFNLVQKKTGFAPGASTKEAINGMSDGQRRKLYDDLNGAGVPKDDVGLIDIKKWIASNPPESNDVAKQAGNEEARRSFVSEGSKAVLEALERIGERKGKRLQTTFGELRGDQKLKNKLDNPAVNIRLARKEGLIDAECRELREGSEEGAVVWLKED